MSAGHSITLLCTQCSQSFQRFASNVNPGQHPFCSKDCHDMFQHLEGLTYQRDVTECPQCLREILRPLSKITNKGKQFCDRACSTAYYADIPARFWEKVDCRSPEECWLWLGTIDSNFGYGAFPYGKAARLALPFATKSKQVSAHRVAFFLRHGRIDLRLNTCHSCDNPPCCNYDHLFEGTQAENMQDMWQKGRHRWQKGVRNV